MSRNLRILAAAVVVVAAGAIIMGIRLTRNSNARLVRTIADDPSIRSLIVQVPISSIERAADEFLRPMRPLDREPLKTLYETLKQRPEDAMVAIQAALGEDASDLTRQKVLLRLISRLYRDTNRAEIVPKIVEISKAPCQDNNLKAEQVFMLGMVDHPATSAALRERIDEEDNFEQMAVLALGEHASVESGKALVQVLKNKNAQIQLWAADIVSIKWPKRQGAAQIVADLLALRSQDSPPLVITLCALAPFESARAEFEKPDVVALLGDAVRKPDAANPFQRTLSIEALGRAHTAACFEELLALIKTPELREFHGSIVAQLALFKDPSYTTRMLDDASGGDESRRAGLLRAVCLACKGEATPAFSEKLAALVDSLIFNGSKEVQQALVEAVGQVAGAPTHEVLLKVIRDHPQEELRLAALSACVDRKAIEEISRTNSSEAVRAEAARRLRQ